MNLEYPIFYNLAGMGNGYGIIKGVAVVVLMMVGMVGFGQTKEEEQLINGIFGWQEYEPDSTFVKDHHIKSYKTLYFVDNVSRLHERCNYDKMGRSILWSFYSTDKEDEISRISHYTYYNKYYITSDSSW